MRSSKYHDYRVLKIALFIILVILGLFIYINCIRAPLEHVADENDWTVAEKATCTEDGVRCKICTECGEEFDHEPIPATGHNPGNAKIENRVESTCTEGGSYDKVVYCKYCNIKLSEEKVYLDLKPHKYGSERQENVLPATHTQPGTYELVSKCVECNEERRIPKVSEPKGHTYDWELKYDEETGKFTMVATCTCDEEGNVLEIAEGNGLAVRLDTTVPSCCRKLYIGTVTIDGKTITEKIELEPDPHSISIEAYDIATGEFITFYYPVSKYAKWDDDYGVYYDYGTEGFIYLNLEGNEWDENGFALGAYKCDICEDKMCSECNGDYWYIVRIYSPKYDTRLTKQSEEN